MHFDRFAQLPVANSNTFIRNASVLVTAKRDLAANDCTAFHKTDSVPVDRPLKIRDELPISISVLPDAPRVVRARKLMMLGLRSICGVRMEAYCWEGVLVGTVSVSAPGFRFDRSANCCSGINGNSFRVNHRFSLAS